LLAVFAFSLKRPVYLDRFFIILLPPLLLLAALGFRAGPRVWRVGGPVLLAAGLGWTSLTYLTPPTAAKEDWRGAVTFLRENAPSVEAIRLLILPDWVSTHYYGLDLADVGQQPEALPPDFWLVVHDPRASAHRLTPFDPPIIIEDVKTLTNWLASSGYTIQERRNFVGVVLLRVTRSSDS
jgi:hypothetical protein